MDILVLGASGMAGHMIATYLSEKGHSVSTISGSRKLFSNTVLMDAKNQSSLTDYLASNTFEYVINCIGLLVKNSESHKADAVYLNSYLPHYLEEYYKNTNTKIIHLSTDCVFSGKHGPYFETTLYDGELFYDHVKAVGELKNNKDLTFRMSIIGPDMNPNGIGLFNWFMKQNNTITGYSEFIWNGITTLELAKAIDASIHNNITGLYHLVPSDPISKYNLLLLFKSEFHKDSISILPNSTIHLNKALISTRSDFNFIVSDYPTMISDMKNWIIQHESLYPHYFDI